MTLKEALENRSVITAYAASNQGLPVCFTPDEGHFVIDTGASITITNEKEGFISPLLLI